MPAGAGEDADARVAVLCARLRQLEQELSRARRSRRVLMDLLWRLDQEWRRRVAHLEEQNRRLWAARRTGAF